MESENIKIKSLRNIDYLRHSTTSRSVIKPSFRFQIMRRDGFKCQLCGSTKDDAKLEIDHKKPISNGGDNSQENLWTLCFKCNRGKGINALNDFDPWKDGETLYQVNCRELENKFNNKNWEIRSAKLTIEILNDELEEILKQLIENEQLYRPEANR
jgi:5-methylcytosine-specific restriction endonuclease McrA